MNKNDPYWEYRSKQSSANWICNGVLQHPHLSFLSLVDLSTIKNEGCLDIDCLRLPFTQWPVTSSASRGSRLQEALNWVNFDASEFLFGNHSRYQWWQGESRSTSLVSRYIVQRLAVQAILEDLKGWGRGVRGWWFLRMKVIFFSFLVAE